MAVCYIIGVFIGLYFAYLESRRNSRQLNSSVHDIYSPQVLDIRILADIERPDFTHCMLLSERGLDKVC